MQLFILRHGQAEARAASDRERRLTADGREEVRQVVRATPELAAVDKILASPYRRAQQTAAVVLEELGERPLMTVDELVPDAPPQPVLDLLAQQSNLTLLLIGHQPLLGKLVNGLAGKKEGYYGMGTGALACLELSHPAFGCGECRWVR